MTFGDEGASRVGGGRYLRSPGGMAHSRWQEYLEYTFRVPGQYLLSTWTVPLEYLESTCTVPEQYL